MDKKENKIGEKMKAFRKDKKISQEELSALSGINVSTIKKYECGFRNPKPDQLVKIAVALDVSIYEFIDYGITSTKDVVCLLHKINDFIEPKFDLTQKLTNDPLSEELLISLQDADLNAELRRYLKYWDRCKQK